MKSLTPRDSEAKLLLVLARGILVFAAALQAKGVSFSLHIYPSGPHGLGLGRPGHEAPPWADECLYWLRERKFLP